MDYAAADPAAESVVLVLDFEDSRPLPQLGNYLMADQVLNMKQVFDAHYDLTDMYVVQLNLGFLYPGASKMVNTISKATVVNGESTIRKLLYSLASMVKLLQGRELGKDFNSIVFALRDNGSDLNQ